MSRKTSPRKTDRRVRRTRDVLGDALVELIHEMPFAAITVQHVLDRAGVSRSTFYTHYKDKEDLFASDVEDFFEGMATLLGRRKEASNRIAPVREMFAHVTEAREFIAALAASNKLRYVLDLAHGHFSRGINQRLAGFPQTRGIPSGQRTATAQVLAGALISLMTWWMDRGMRESPEQMDNLYHQIVWQGVCPGPNQAKSISLPIRMTKPWAPRRFKPGKAGPEQARRAAAHKTHPGR